MYTDKYTSMLELSPEFQHNHWFSIQSFPVVRIQRFKLSFNVGSSFERGEKGTAKSHLDISKAKCFLFNLIIVECSQVSGHIFYPVWVFASQTVAENSGFWKQLFLCLSGIFAHLHFSDKSTSFPCGNPNPNVGMHGCFSWASLNFNKGSLGYGHTET